MAKQRPSFEQACSRYVHRFTMDHVPEWARMVREDGTFYAPQYRSDREWYDNTLFPGEAAYPFGKRDTSCFSTGATWPLGQSLAKPYRR